jgi:muramoyltetrapeptide carboxypeptidase
MKLAVPPKAPALRAHDRVAVVAPAGPFDRESFEVGLSLLRARYTVTFDEGLFSRERYLAGSDDRRWAELQTALDDSSVKAVFCARGGYGTLRLLHRLRPPRSPKLLVGFSDITALHAFLQREGWASVHGPVLTQLGRQPELSVQRFFSLLESPVAPSPLTGAEPLVPGVVEGPLVGGNLAVFSRLLGTPFLPPLDRAILLLEDVGERPYALDRLWTHLELAGVYGRIAGLALGTFTSCEERDADYTSAQVIESLARKTGLPCARHFAVGHGEVNLAVPLGARVRLDATKGELHFLEGAVA